MRAWVAINQHLEQLYVSVREEENPVSSHHSRIGNLSCVNSGDSCAMLCVF